MAAFKIHQGHRDPLADDFKNYLSAPYAKVTNSGTAALYLILETLKKLSLKKTVVIPSYICPLVPLAIARAGLKVEVCDITGRDYNFNPGELDRLCAENGDLLAVVATHIGGLPVDMGGIEEAAKKRGIFVIEDCAQSLGACYKAKQVGTIGDFSFFSLARGKGLTIYEGGVAVCNRPEFSKAIDEAADKILKDEPFQEGLKIAELFGYSLFYRPLFFWFVFRLPQVFWNARGDKTRANQDYYTADFPVHRVSGMRQSVGHAVFSRLEKEIEDQRAKAEYMISLLESAAGIRIIRESPGDRAVYPFLTVLFDNPLARGRAISALKKTGLGGSVLYLYPITGYDYLRGIIPPKDARGAAYLAERAMILSTSSYLKKEDLNKVVEHIAKVAI